MAANPTGLADGLATTNWAAMPTGGPGNYGYGTTVSPTPPGPAAPGVQPQAWGMTPGASTGVATPSGSGGSSYPTVGASAGNPLSPTPTSGNPPLGPGGAPPMQPGYSTAEQQGLQNSLAGTFHTGYGTYLEQLLNSQGGYNSQLTAQNVQDQIAAMQTNINRGYSNLQTQLGQQGISPNSSTAALESAFYMSDATTQENALVANEYYNMWNASQQREFGLAESIEGPMASQKQSENWQSQLGAIGGFIGAVDPFNVSVSL